MHMKALRVKIAKSTTERLWYANNIGQEFWARDLRPMPDGIDLQVIHEGLCNEESRLWIRSEDVKILREAVVNVEIIQTVEEL